MPIHWFFESVKWRELLRPAISITHIKAYQAILSGVLFALFTPNHLGQYGGRIWFLPPHHASSGIFATLVGSFAQNIVYTIGGIIGMALLIPRYLSFHGNYLLLALAFFATLVLLYVYFNIPQWITRSENVTWIVKLKSKIKNFQWLYPLPIKT